VINLASLHNIDLLTAMLLAIVMTSCVCRIAVFVGRTFDMRTPKRLAAIQAERKESEKAWDLAEQACIAV
jgi:hypothetical protein